MDIIRSPADIGPLIREQRKKRRLTQGEVAEAVGLRTPTICDMEKGRCVPSIESLFALCRYFEVDLWILGTDSEPKDR